jgi:hypothetical protein
MPNVAPLEPRAKRARKSAPEPALTPSADLLDAAAFDLAYQRHLVVFGKNNAQAGARREHDLADLVSRASLTQKEIAARIKRSQQYVSRLLNFASFCSSAAAANVKNFEDVREARFYKARQHVDAALAEPEFSAAIVALLNAPPPPRVARAHKEAVINCCCDDQPRTVPEIAAATALDVSAVEAALAALERSHSLVLTRANDRIRISAPATFTQAAKRLAAPLAQLRRISPECAKIAAKIEAILRAV